MKKLLFLLCSFFVFTTVVQAQEVKWREISFSELGWERDVKLEGSNPSYTLYFPNFPGVDWEQSYLYLQIEPSPILGSTSSLSVYGDGNLLLTTPLRGGLFSIPLRALSPNEEQHRLEIQPSLFISDNLCEDLASGNLFCFIKKESRLSLLFKETPILTFTDFLRLPEKDIEIILPPGKWSRELEEAYFMLYIFLRRSFRNLPVRIKTRVLTEESSFLEDHRRIFLREQGEQDFELHGRSLSLTPRGVEAIVQGKDLLVFPSLKISMVKSTTTPLVRRIPLNGFSLRGIGTLTETFYFPSSDLGGIPQTLKLVLYRSYSPLRENFPAEASCTVRFNGEPIFTERLDADPLPRKPLIIALPPHLLRRENALEFRFSYFPEIGNCRRGEMPLEVSVSSDSYIEAQGQGPFPPILSWGDVPTFFWGRGFIVLPDKPDIVDLEISARILASLRSLDRTPFTVTVMNLREAETWLSRPSPWPSRLSWFSQRGAFLRQKILHYAQILETQNIPLPQKILALSRFAVGEVSAALGETIAFFIPSPFEVQEPAHYFILVNPSHYFSSPLVPEGKDLVFKDVTEGKTIMRFGPAESLGILTTFWENGHPVILFATHGEPELATKYFLKIFEEERTLRRLNGNVALFTQRGLSSTMAGVTGNTPPPREWSLKLRLLVFLLIAGGIIFLAGFFYNRLVRPKTS